MGASSPIEAIQTLGNYTLLEKLGEGYLGSVFRGFDQHLGQAVAIRILCDGIKWDARIEEILNSQCRSVAGLQHTGIASILEFGKEGQSHYIVMESLGNCHLKSLIADRSAMTVETKLSIMIQVAEGLSYAHKNGILHRDLEPSKIHVTADGKAKIRDFAIAYVLMKHLPHPAVRWGVPIYLSPEQIQQKDCDPRSDIFSAGIIFYEFLTYLHPFHDHDSNKALDNILMNAQIPTFDMFPDVPPGIWSILKTCLAKDPKDRYQNMDELSSACRDLLKDLAEDSRLMLSELYGAITPLRKAAEKPDARESTIALLQDIQNLLRSDKEADYISLDRLMTILIEQYPIVQAISGSLPAPAPVHPELPPEETKIEIAETPRPSSLHAPEGIYDPAPMELALTTGLVSGSPELSTAPAFYPQALPCEQAAQTDIHGDSESPFAETWDFSSEMHAAFEASFVKPEEDRIFASEFNQEEAPPEQTPAAVSPSPVPEPPMEPADKSQATPDEKSEPGDKIEHGETHCAESANPSPKPQSLPEVPLARQEQEKTPDEKWDPDAAAGIETKQNSGVDTKPAGAMKARLATCYRRIPRPSYRSAVVLLSLLVMAAAAYIARGTDVAVSMSNALRAHMLHSSVIANAFARLNHQKSRNVQAVAGTQESKAVGNPQIAVPAVMETQQPPPIENIERKVSQPPQELITRISGLIASGKLQLAKTELDRLQQSYPTAPKVFALRKQWAAKNSTETVEQAIKEEEQLKAAWKQKDDEWNRRLAGLLARGQYGEANSALNLWVAEDPESQSAREIGGKVAEIQRNLNIYASAMAENKYPEALNAVNNAERLNPADSSFAELRRQIEARKAAAKASLTIHRLGSKATLLLDGRPLGNEGEIENEPILIGNHTLAIENGGSLVVSRHQEFLEGQRVALVYDLARQNLRTMVDADRELLAQRKAMEEVRYFDVEHEHGTLRGSCRGLLMIDYLDVVFRPSSGFHGFRIPLKLLKLSVKGKSIEFLNISDDQHFQSFKLHDEQIAEKFRRSWDELKAFAQQ